MKNKNSRLDAIRLIIGSMEVCSQQELKEELEKEGFTPTQATLSRDLKQLNVVKTANAQGKYRYVLMSSPSYRRYSDFKPVISAVSGSMGFLSIKFSGSLAVIHTRPSYASSMAYHIDALGSSLILGTIAGDDTLFLALSEGATRTEVMKVLAGVIPEIA